MPSPSDPLDPSAPPRPPAAGDALPLLALAAAIDSWERDPDDARGTAVLAALGSVIGARGAHGGWIRLDVSPWPVLDGPLGEPGAASAPPPGDAGGWLPLHASDGRVRLGAVAIDASVPDREVAFLALRTGLDLAWARTAARAANERLDALDAATAAITSELSVDRVLQVIVERVRPLVGARYAALGIVGDHGRIDRFITSGIDDETRRRIGHLPRGRGILGLIIRENTSIRLADLMADPRAVGFPPNHPPMHTFMGVPVTVEGRSIGNLYLTDKQGDIEFSTDDERLVETFARHAGIAIHNARLHQELQHLAVLQERDRIGQDLHDGIIQALYGVGLSLEDVGELMTDDPSEAMDRVERSIENIHGTIRDIRNFISGLRPELLEDLDLGGGLASLTDEFRRSTLIETSLTADGATELDAEDAFQLLQLAREALSNVARHADASHVAVELAVADGMLSLIISDDGRGFDPVISRGPAHRGLTNMRARAASLGGTLTMDSRPSAGTRVTFKLPLGQDTRTEETRS